jgi:hypothetical protein
VSAFCFVGGSDELRFDKEPWLVMELSSIHYFPEPVERIDHFRVRNQEAEQHRVYPNFLLEIWLALLYIEARSVVINGIRFNVGYPKIDG